MPLGTVTYAHGQNVVCQRCKGQRIGGQTPPLEEQALVAYSPLHTFSICSWHETDIYDIQYPSGQSPTTENEAQT